MSQWHSYGNKNICFHKYSRLFGWLLIQVFVWKCLFEPQNALCIRSFWELPFWNLTFPWDCKYFQNPKPTYFNFYLHEFFEHLASCLTALGNPRPKLFIASSGIYLLQRINFVLRCTNSYLIFWFYKWYYEKPGPLNFKAELVLGFPKSIAKLNIYFQYQDPSCIL